MEIVKLSFGDFVLNLRDVDFFGISLSMIDVNYMFNEYVDSCFFVVDFFENFEGFFEQINFNVDIRNFICGEVVKMMDVIYYVGFVSFGSSEYE